MLGLFIPFRHDRIVYILLAMMDDSFEFLKRNRL